MGSDMHGSSAFAARLFEMLPLGIVYYDSNLCVIDCNDRFVKIIHSARERIIGVDMHKLPDAKAVGCLQQALLGREGHYEGPYHAITSDVDLWICLHTAPVLGESGELIGGISIVEDISERRAAEENLRSREQRYRLLYQQSPIGIIHYDMNLKITEYNDRLVEILKSKHELLKDFDLSRIPDPKIVSIMRAALEGTPGFYEGRYKSLTSGADLWLSSRIGPMCDAGDRITGGICIIEDISDRMEAEMALKEKMSEVERLNRFMMGRETRVLELKHEINHLLQMGGKPKRYQV